MTFGNVIEALSERLGTKLEDAGGASAIDIDGITVVLQDAGEMLLVRAEIGEFPPEGRAEILASAMESNFLYRGTGGATLAVNPSDGKLHLQKYNWMERIDADSAVDMLERFADTAGRWRKLLEDYRPGITGEDTVIPSGNFMQV